jgi:hypothetical protein
MMLDVILTTQAELLEGNCSGLPRDRVFTSVEEVCVSLILSMH